MRTHIVGFIVVVVGFLARASEATAFGCKNSLISDDWREAVLKYHNDQRRKVSRGQQTDKDGAALKTAGEMYQLTWDCNLEAIAHTELVKCAGVSKITIGQTEHDFNEGVISTKPKKCNLEDDTKTLLKSWWNEVRQETFPTDMKYTEKFRHFAPMAYDKAKGVGCTYTTCGSETKMVCAYTGDIVSQSANTAKEMYTHGNTCDTCKCVEYLCQDTYTPVAAPMTCDKDKLSDELKEAVENMHNYYRRLLATGWAKNKLSSTGYAPIASKMLAVKYACDAIGEEAYTKSQNCDAAIGDPTAGRGMNKLEIKNHTMSHQEALEEAMKTWWGQLETEGLPDDLMYTDEIANAGKITEFATIANELVESVGCAVTTCKKTGLTRVVCEYDKSLAPDDAVYTKAKKKPCSDCTNIQKACGKDSKEGLCV